MDLISAWSVLRISGVKNVLGQARRETSKKRLKKGVKEIMGLLVIEGAGPGGME
jgi:hypothetical protein